MKRRQRLRVPRRRLAPCADRRVPRVVRLPGRRSAASRSPVPGGRAVTVPRHTDVRTVTAVLSTRTAVPAPLVPVAPFTMPLLGKLLNTPLRGVLRTARSTALPEGPPEDERRAVAVDDRRAGPHASTAARTAPSCTARTSTGMTARALVWAARADRGGRARGRGRARPGGGVRPRGDAGRARATSAWSGRRRHAAESRLRLAFLEYMSAVTASADRSTSARCPRGPHRLAREEVRESQRGRMIDAIAEAVAAKGYAATTVGDVVSGAGVSRKTFYEHFTTRRSASWPPGTPASRCSFAAIMASRDQARRSDRADACAACARYLDDAGGRARVRALVPDRGRRRRAARRGAGVPRCTRSFADLFAHAARAGAARAARPARRARRAIPRRRSAAINELVSDYVRSGRTEQLPELEDTLVYLLARAVRRARRGRRRDRGAEPRTAAAPAVRHRRDADPRAPAGAPARDAGRGRGGLRRHVRPRTRTRSRAVAPERQDRPPDRARDAGAARRRARARSTRASPSSSGSRASATRARASDVSPGDSRAHRRPAARLRRRGPPARPADRQPRADRAATRWSWPAWASSSRRARAAFGSDAERAAGPRDDRARARGGLNGSGRIPREDTVVIGDTPLDVAAAHADGVRAIGVARLPLHARGPARGGRRRRGRRARRGRGRARRRSAK